MTHSRVRLASMKVSFKFQIEDKQLKKLKIEAKRRGCTIAQVLRDLVHNVRFDAVKEEG